MLDNTSLKWTGFVWFTRLWTSIARERNVIVLTFCEQFLKPGSIIIADESYYRLLDIFKVSSLKLSKTVDSS